jgi:hypothetical protein
MRRRSMLSRRIHLSFLIHKQSCLGLHITYLDNSCLANKQSFFCDSKLQIHISLYPSHKSGPNLSVDARSLSKRVETPTFELGEVLRQYKDTGTNADQFQLPSKVRIDGSGSCFELEKGSEEPERLSQMQSEEGIKLLMIFATSTC